MRAFGAGFVVAAAAAGIGWQCGARSGLSIGFFGLWAVLVAWRARVFDMLEVGDAEGGIDGAGRPLTTTGEDAATGVATAPVIGPVIGTPDLVPPGGTEGGPAPEAAGP